MRQFLKYVLATIVGIIILSFLMFILFGVMIGSSVKKSFEEEKVKISANSVLKLDFTNPLSDRPTEDASAFGDFLPVDVEGNYGLRPTIEAINRAAEDDKIRGIYINSDGLSIGFANLTELEKAIEEFKQSGKFVVANSRFMSEKNYGLVSAADEIYMHPEGYFDFKGLYANTTFIKGMLDKLGIEPQVFYVGDFKSATEPVRRKNMSEASKLQTKEYLEDIYSNYIEMVAENRGKAPEEVRDISDNMKIKTVEEAEEMGMIDGLKYDDEVYSILREKIGIDEDDDLDFVSLQNYSDSKEIGPNGKSSGSNRIAIVYAEGGIGMGDNDGNSGIGGDQYAKILRKIRKNDKIKAVVLRVNSGGGSAFASDLIWREIELMKEKKPVVASMGNVAASGGYYILTNADKIYAEENTITGSIGVFGVLMNLEEFFEDKLGITSDGVGTGKYSDFPNLMKEWSSEEKAIIQSQVEDIYGDFIGKVAAGRDMSEDQVHEIAQGRVWSGEDALDIGLIDEIGGLQQALDHAIELAKIDEPKLSIYPRVKTPFERFQEIFDLEARADKLVNNKLNKYGDIKKQIELIESFKEPQMRMPFEIEID